VEQFRRFVDATGYVTEPERNGGGRHLVAPQGTTERRPEFIWRSPGFEQEDSHPVLLVTWNDARAFCEWLSSKDGRRYRLPTEAEWEYCCRAGSAKSWSGSNYMPFGADTYGNIADRC
jgi:formylglycine-generating enzyme required for sulfatase activity